MIVGGRQTKWQHLFNTLIESCISFSAHYLGSMEISNVEETEDSRRAMIKLKVRNKKKYIDVFNGNEKFLFSRLLCW